MSENPLSVDHLLDETRVFPPPSSFSDANLSLDEYETMYRRSIEDSDAFWLEQAKELEWFRLPKEAGKYQWDPANNQVKHTWFADGELNVTVNCLDRHIEAGQGDRIAFHWQGDEDSECRTFTYQELLEEVCRFSNVMKELGVQKGDRVCLYLPMIPELAIAVLACARIGAIHSVVFGGFSAESLAHRIDDSSCKLLITSNVGLRGGKEILLKQTADDALGLSSSIENVLVVKRNDSICTMMPGRDHWYHEKKEVVSNDCPPEPMNAEDPLFILYTSGTTGKPKGAVHTQAGYLLYASLTHKYVFDIRKSDVYWCTADIGWITGHSYIVYGPLANGCTSVLFEGTPTYPDAGRFWQVVEKYGVTVFYTAPTALRALMRDGKEWPEKHNLDSLRLLGTVGEPINPEAWMWYYNVIGQKRCPIVDTWWQTETGGILITPLPGAHATKPGSAGRPFFGVEPVVLKGDGTECAIDEGGSLCIKRPWPALMRTAWGDHKRFIDTYFKTFPGTYYTGDGCRKDPDGDFWLMGRLDDVVNISGHRIGTAEVESALVSHPSVTEAAVVPIPHSVKGQGLYAFVTLLREAKENPSLKEELIQHVRKMIGPIATPEYIQFANALPKTRSGKIMRRILRKIAENDPQGIGDTTTLLDAHVVDDLLTERAKG